MASSTSFEHAPSLDGVRGLAVGAVVVYHFWPDVLPGGFIGVDVFFVLSGFLLSSLLVREVERTGRVAVGAFFLRRFRRLLPAMLLLLVAISAYAAFWADEIELARLRRHLLGALTYTINWLFIADGTTYTDVIVGASPLRHMWSLAIEEQFYIVLALAVATVVAIGRTAVRARLAIGALVLATLSAGWMVALSLSGASIARTYFGTDARVHAMLIGVALGVTIGDRVLDRDLGRPIDRRHASLAFVIGTTVLVVVALTGAEDAAWMHRGGLVLVALASASILPGALVLPVAARALSVAPLAGLGVISYGVYLWHWPILVIFDAERVGTDGPALAAFRLALTLLVSLASYVAVERPIRRGVIRRTVGSAGVLVGLTSAVAVGLVAVASTVPPDVLGVASPSSPATVTTTATTVADSPDGVVEEPAGGTDEPLRVAVVGDSVAHTLIGGELTGFLDAVPWTPDQTTFDPGRVEIVSVARPACSFLPGEIAFEQPGGRFESADLSSFCSGWDAELRGLVEENDPVDATFVLLTNDLEDRSVDGSIVEVGTPEWDELMTAWLDEIRALAVTDDSKLVLVAAAPRIDPTWTDPQGAREAHVAGLYADYAAATPGVEVVDLSELIDGTGSGDPDVRYDGLHFTDAGARWVADWLTGRLERLVRA